MDESQPSVAQPGGDLIGDRHVRVFISSTFRDMQRERDHLVRFTFPELRKLCESRGVVWTEVDLRWGVPTEQASEGKVLPICLEEIRRCRPYFIGMLGERYGWTPDAFGPEAIAREPWLNDHLHGGKSVTELEILQGVLNDPKMGHHAFFYFRDPAYVQGIPPEQRMDFVCENPAAAEKLVQLKDRIRRSTFPVRENYADPKALGDLVLKDLTAVINSLYPKGTQPDPLEREAMDHAAYAASRAKVYIGRQAYFDRLDAYADGDEERPLVVLGESGSGKSALLANWVLRYQKRHPNDVVIQHFIGASPYSADWVAMLRRILGELAKRLKIDRPIPDQPGELRTALGAWLGLAAAKGEGRRVVLVLDALNQLEDKDQALELPWLPELTPASVRVLVSTLPGRPLEEAQRRSWPVFKVEPLAMAEREALIVQYLSQYAKALGPAQSSRIAKAPQSANPLYLRVLLDELRIFGQHQALNAKIDYYLKADSPYTLYGRVIERWENDYGGDSELVGDTLSLLWAARRGLSENELLEALGTPGNPLPRAHWSPLFLAMNDGLISRGGLLTFAHDFLRTAARDANVPMESHQHKAHIRLADYFEQQSAESRRLDEFPWQLCEGKAWERLATFLADPGSFFILWTLNQFEVKTYWAAIESSSPLRMTDVYRTTIENPDVERDALFLQPLDLLLGNMGHPAESLRLRSAQVDHYRESGNLDGLSKSLGNQAVTLKARGDLDGAMTLHKEEERICRQLGNADGLQRSLGNQATILQARGELDEAMTLHKEQERICRQLGNLDSLQTSLGNQALILHVRGDLDGAMTLLNEKERICRQLGNLDSLQRSLGNQVILHARGDLDGAMTLLKQQERICRQLGNVDNLQWSLGTQALILHARGELDEAMTLCKEQERICRQLGNVDSLQVCLGGQAGILGARGDLDGAMTLRKEQERICRQLGNVDSLQRSLGGQATILQARGELDEAMTLLKEQERICRQLGNVDGLAGCLGNQALILKARGDLGGAMTLLKEQERICRQLGNVDSLQRSLGNQALILKARGDLGEAMTLLKEQERICRQLGNVDSLQRSLGNQALILKARGDLGGAMTLHKEQERICRQLGNVDGLAVSLANQASLLRTMGRLQDGLSLAEEAHRLATSRGYAPLARQIEPILNALRREVQGVGR